MESVWPVSKLSTKSVGSRRELVANCVHTADATKQFRRIGGVYWALHALSIPGCLHALSITRHFQAWLFTCCFHYMRIPYSFRKLYV